MLRFMMLGPALINLAMFAPATPAHSQEPATGRVTPRIAWFGRLADGLDEARRTSRPILLVSGAPHCLGVPGIW